ncbi:MAG: hypothetical protein GXP34_13620 [Actinobacteria bacterium]|nr:hypothetical protein [Actinomycetota bacterium]
MARGAIDRRDNGRYRARYEAPDGRWRSRTFDRKVDAQRWLADQLSQLNRGMWIDPTAGQVAFDTYALSWLAAKTRIKPKARGGYRSLLRSRIMPTPGPIRLATIDRRSSDRGSGP